MRSPSGSSLRSRYSWSLIQSSLVEYQSLRDGPLPAKAGSTVKALSYSPASSSPSAMSSPSVTTPAVNSPDMPLPMALPMPLATGPRVLVTSGRTAEPTPSRMGMMLAKSPIGLEVDVAFCGCSSSSTFLLPSDGSCTGSFGAAGLAAGAGSVTACDAGVAAGAGAGAGAGVGAGASSAAAAAAGPPPTPLSAPPEPPSKLSSSSSA